MTSLNSLPTTKLDPVATKSDQATQLLNLTTHHMRDLAAIELRTLIFFLAHINSQGQYLLDLERLPKSKTKQPDPARQQLHQDLAEKHNCPLVTLADFHKSLGMSPTTVLRVLKRLAALRLIAPIKQLGFNITLRQLTIPDHPLDQIPFAQTDNDSPEADQHLQPDDLYQESESDASQVAELPDLDDSRIPTGMARKQQSKPELSPQNESRAASPPGLSAHANIVYKEVYLARTAILAG